MNIYYKFMEGPVGILTLIADESHLLEIRWEDGPKSSLLLTQEDNNHPILIETEKQLAEYFKGKRKVFDIPLKLIGTPFQQKVWKLLQEIPFASTQTYSDLAKKLGNAEACRAVGAANGKNPLSIIVPCHRVIGKSGNLTGFAGGLNNKAILLSIESETRKCEP